MRYPGGKNSGGAYQTVINQIPPHRTYIAPFCGSDPIARFKRPAEVSILIDIDRKAVVNFNRECRRRKLNLTALQGCGIEFLQSYEYAGDEFIYADPPYMVSSTLKRRHVYPYSLNDEDHIRLLRILKSVPAAVAVAIAGYENDLYASELEGWRRITYQSMTRGRRMATECLWMNYPAPAALHNYRYLGKDRTERQRIKRKAERWAAKLAKMPLLEKQALLAALAASGELAQAVWSASTDVDVSDSPRAQLTSTSGDRTQSGVASRDRRRGARSPSLPVNHSGEGARRGV